MPDSLATLAADYRAMSPRERRAVRKLLDAGERQALERLAAEQAEEILSPWLAARCREAGEGAGPLTPAVRRALVPQESHSAPVNRPRGPSLAGRVGSLLGAML